MASEILFISRTNNIPNPLSTGIGKSTLKNGDKIFVRVLSSSPNQNSYNVSFSGIQAKVYSEIPLKVGQSFNAVINEDGGKFLIKPESESVLVANAALNDESGLKKINSENAKTNQKIQTILKNLGLVNDETSFSLLQMFIQNKVKINPNEIRRSYSTGHRVAKKNPKANEKIASETALEFIMKGINDEDELILEFLSEFTGNNEPSNKNENENEEKKQDKSRQCENEDFTAKIFESSDWQKTDGGNLALFNHLKIKNSDIHTILIPFEFEQKSGAILMTLNTLKNDLERLLIHYQKFLFDINPLQKKITFFIDEITSKSKIESIITMLQKDFTEYEIIFDKALQNHLFSFPEGVDFLSETI